MEELFKEFWPVALFAVISIISYARNEAKTKQDDGDMYKPQPETIDENFPEVEVYESSSTPVPDPVKPVCPTNKKLVKKEYVSVKGITKPVETSASSVPERGKKISLKEKSDAKKAFIYSEILNRKY